MRRARSRGLEREKQVILSELGEASTRPTPYPHHLFEAALGNQPLARPVLGREPSILALTRDDCLGWLGQEYRPSRLVISAAGAVDPDAILAMAERLFGDLEPVEPSTIPSAQFIGGIRSDRKAAEQTHLAFALSGLPSSHDSAPALALFSQAVGGGMSSRLFQELREERGLAYSIYAWTQGYADTGLFAVNLSTDKARAAEAMALARDCVSRAAEDLTDAELDRARAQVEAGLIMALETPQGRADSMARSIEIFNRIMDLDEMLAELRSVTD